VFAALITGGFNSRGGYLNRNRQDVALFGTGLEVFLFARPDDLRVGLLEKSEPDHGEVSRQKHRDYRDHSGKDQQERLPHDKKIRFAGPASAVGANDCDATLFESLNRPWLLRAGSIAPQH